MSKFYHFLSLGMGAPFLRRDPLSREIRSGRARQVIACRQAVRQLLRQYQELESIAAITPVEDVGNCLQEGLKQSYEGITSEEKKRLAEQIVECFRACSAERGEIIHS